MSGAKDPKFKTPDAYIEIMMTRYKQAVATHGNPLIELTWNSAIDSQFNRRAPIAQKLPHFATSQVGQEDDDDEDDGANDDYDRVWQSYDTDLAIVADEDRRTKDRLSQETDDEDSDEDDDELNSHHPIQRTTSSFIRQSSGHEQRIPKIKKKGFEFDDDDANDPVDARINLSDVNPVVNDTIQPQTPAVKRRKETVAASINGSTMETGQVKNMRKSLVVPATQRQISFEWGKIRKKDREEDADENDNNGDITFSEHGNTCTEDSSLDGDENAMNIFDTMLAEKSQSLVSEKAKKPKGSTYPRSSMTAQATSSSTTTFSIATTSSTVSTTATTATATTATETTATATTATSNSKSSKAVPAAATTVSTTPTE